MISIDFDRFTTEAEFHTWLLSDDGIKLFDYIYDTIINSYGKPVRHIPVITKKCDDNVYSIDMKNLTGFCERAIKVYESTESYERCAKLLVIIQDQNEMDNGSDR